MKILVVMFHNLYHWMQNILPDNLSYKHYFVTITELFLYTVLKPHQFDKSFCCL